MQHTDRSPRERAACGRAPAPPRARRALRAALATALVAGAAGLAGTGSALAAPGAERSVAGPQTDRAAAGGFDHAVPLTGPRRLVDTSIGPFLDAAGDPAPDLRTLAFRHDDLNPGITSDDRINFQTQALSPVVLRDGDEIRYEFDIDNNRATGSPTGGEVGVSLIGSAASDDVWTVRWNPATSSWVLNQFLGGTVFDPSAIDFWVLRDTIGVPRGANAGIIVRTFNAGGFADVAPESNSYLLPIDQAPLPPTAVAGGATASGTSSATFAGEVNPGGVPTTYRFQYGTTPTYGLETSPVDVGAGRAPVPVSQAISGLAPGTTYHWRLVATSAAGEVASPNQTVTTIPSPPTAATGRGIPRGPRALRLTGVADTKGVPGTVFFEFGRTTRFGSRSSSLAVNGSAERVRLDLRGLRRNTVYFYRLVVDTAGGRAVGRNLSVRTADFDQIVASVDAPIASVGNIFTVPRFRTRIRIVSPTGAARRAPSALRRVRVHVLCTRGCSVNQRFSLGRRRAVMRAARGGRVVIPIRRNSRQAVVDLTPLFGSHQFTPGSQIQLRISGPSLRGSANVITLKSVARRLRCDLRNNRPVACEVP